jgi:lysine decarboxylase
MARADLKSIADICHERGKPLIVDEAWGAHLPFHPDLPTWAMDAGADVCVVSVHKMGTGFEQGSVFHRQGDLVDPHQLSACADLLMTTSPNVMVYAALDGWRRQMVQHGHDQLDAALTLAGHLMTLTRYRSSSMYPAWTSAAVTRPTGYVDISALTWDSATTAG